MLLYELSEVIRGIKRQLVVSNLKEGTESVALEGNEPEAKYGDYEHRRSKEVGVD